MTDNNARRLAWILTVLLAIGAGVEAGDAKKSSWTLKSALKQIDKTVKQYHAATGKVQWDQLLNDDAVHGSGTVRIDFSGRICADVAGSNPRTLMAVPPYLYIYQPLQHITDSYFLPSNRSLLAQYAMVGFFPAGNDMRSWFDLKLVRQDKLDGHETLLLSLTPLPSKDPLSISNFLLWLDTTSWLPVQQVIRDEASGMQITLKFSDLELVDALAPDTFTTAWPDGTPVIKH